MKKVNIEKKIVLGLVLASILLLSYVVTTSSGQNGTVVSIDSYTVSPGETIEVSINISNAINLATAEIYLNYDPSIVHVTAVSNGDFDLTLKKIHNDSGWTRIGGAQLMSDPLNGDVTLACVTLETLGSPGSISPLTLSNLLFQDITGALLSITPHNGTFTIYGSMPSVSIQDCLVQASETITIPLMIYDTTDMASVEVNISYDSSVVQVLSVLDGDFDLTLSEIHNESGWTRIGGTQLISDWINDDAVLAQVSFKAYGRACSSSLLEITDVLAQNKNGLSISMEKDNGLFEIGSTLTISIVGEGRVNIEPRMDIYPCGTSVTLNATGEYPFDYWTGNLTGNENPTSIIMDSDKTITAYFTRDTSYTLTVNIDGDGTVTRGPDQATYTHGTVVTLTAVPDTGWTFSHWTGGLTGSTNPDTTTMPGDKTVTAHFIQKAYSLTITTDGDGTVTKNPNQATYTHGTVVTLTAVPDTGWTFSHWTGGLTGSTNPDTITMTGDKTVTAHFISTVYCEWHLTITTEGNGIFTASPLQDTYSCNQCVTLIATPASGWTFSHWSGGLTEPGNPITIYYANPITVTMNNHKTFTAHFIREGAIRDVSANPSPQNPREPITISCYIPDSIQVNEVTAVIFYPHGILKEKISLKPDFTGNTYYCTQTFNIPGWYSYFIRAEDTDGYTIFSDWNTIKIIPQ